MLKTWILVLSLFGDGDCGASRYSFITIGPYDSREACVSAAFAVKKKLTMGDRTYCIPAPEDYKAISGPQAAKWAVRLMVPEIQVTEPIKFRREEEVFNHLQEEEPREDKWWLEE